MKKLLTTLTIAALSLAAQAQTPAFPGAEGHGRYTTGGRGGTVIHVTNLNDSGTGSFRAAVNGSSKKIVVFDVGGVIALKSDVTIGANTTILGQTAPAPGITLRYYTLLYGGNNIIVRFIRSRRGQEKNTNDGADATWTRNKTGIILDHCSFSWSIDEVASFYDNNNFTMQWCTIGESLNNAGHGKGAHGYGGIWGGKLASFHHNLICHVNNRSPRFNGARYNWTGYTGNKLYSQYQWENAVQAENVDFRNCVVYNCGNGCYGGPGGGKVKMVNNYYKTGPAGSTSRLTTVSVGDNGNAEDNPIYWTMTSRYYLSGNRINSTANAGWSYMSYDNGTYTINGKRYSPDPNHYNGASETYVKNSAGTDCICMQLDEPAPTDEVTTHSAVNAFNKVLAYSGASLFPDDVDQRYFTEAKNGTATYKGSVTNKAGRIDLVSDVNGYTEENFGTGSRAADFDADGDGIADAWEQANGGNLSANGYDLDPKKYYTNIEVYANSLVQDIMLAGNADADDAINEYYPAYTKEDGTRIAAIGESSTSIDPVTPTNVSYVLASSTNTGENTASVYTFENDVTISNTKSKGYATGNNGGIKYSAGVQYTINLPAGININNLVFTGYDNYTDVDAYLGEVNGVSYDATTYIFPKSKEVVSRTVTLSEPATGAITFTPQGKQCVFSITLNGSKGTVTAISDVPAATPRSGARYNLRGQRVDSNYRGVVIKDGKKYFQNH